LPTKKDGPSTEKPSPPRRNSIYNSWKEKLGIETSQDLLIFGIVISFAATVLAILVTAGLGYIVPIPY